MPDQPSLFEPDPAPAVFHPEVVRGRSGRAAGYTLFIALVPTAELAQHALQLVAELRKRRGLRGRSLSLENLHVSLHAIADFDDQIPMQMIDAAKAAAARIACPALPITFVSACSFPSRLNPDRNPFVLRCDAQSDAVVARLRHALGSALRQSGLRPEASSSPHMTLLYDRQVIREHPIEPIGWRAASFRLILSHQGLGHHERVGEWPLA